MEIVNKEIHYYLPSVDTYHFDKDQYSEYQVFLVEGFLANLWHTFVLGVDYELFNNGIRWLSGDRPEAPPSNISTAGNIPFEITYVYETSAIDAMVGTVFPFVKENGLYLTIVRSLGSQIMQIYEKKNSLLIEHNMEKASGDALDLLGAWYNVLRTSGESDESLRGRLLEFLESYASSGTVDAVIAAITSYTGVEPDITELWQNISYFNYNIDDYNDINLSPDQWRTYLFSGGAPDNIYTFQAYFYDPLFQLNTFFCILPYETITDVGIENIKSIISRAKAAGIQGYLAWLVNETFEDLDDWEVVT